MSDQGRNSGSPYSSNSFRSQNSDSGMNSPAHSISSQNSDQQSQITGLVRQNNQLNSQVQELKSRIELITAQHKKEKDNLTNVLESARKTNQDSVQDLNSSLTSLENEYESEVQKNKELTKENGQLKTQINVFLSYINSVSDTEVNNLTEATAFVTKIINSSNDSVDQIKFLEQKNQTLVEQAEENSQIIQEASRQIKILKRNQKQIVKASQAESQQNQDVVVAKLKKHYQEKIKRLQSDLENQSEEISTLKKAIHQTKTQQAHPVIIPAPPDNTKELFDANYTILQDKYEKALKNIDHQANEISALEEQNQKLLNINENIYAQVKEDADRIEKFIHDIDALQISLKQTKQAYKQQVELVKLSKNEQAELETQQKELKLHISELESQLTAQKVTQSIPTNDIDEANRCKQELDSMKETLDSFEELIQAQSGEIQQVHQQRTSLLVKLQQVDEFLSTYDSYIQALEKSNIELEEQAIQLTDAATNAIEEENEEFREAYNRILDQIPEHLVEQVSQLENLPKYKVLSQVAEILMDELENGSHSSKAEIEEFSNNVSQKYDALFDHLENAYNFMKSIANSQSAKSGKRTQLLTQCARIGKFIDENKTELNTHCSFFEPMQVEDPEKVAKAFLDFISDEQLQESPFRELCTLFLCVTQVNAMLMNSIESNSQVLSNSQNVAQQYEESKEKIRELQRYKDTQTELNEKLSACMQKFVEEKIDDFPTLAETFMKEVEGNGIPVAERQQLTANIEDLTEQINILQMKIAKSNKKVENERQEFCKEADQLTIGIENKLKLQSHEYEKQIANLTAQLESARNELNQNNDQIEQISDKTTKRITKQNQLIQTLNEENAELTDQLNELQEKFTKTSDAYEELTATNQDLASQVNELNETLNTTVQKKKSYKLQLQQLESSSESTISKLRKTNEDLTLKYEQSIKELSANLSQTHEALVAAQNEVNSFSEYKQNLILQNAKLTMAQRSLTLKLNAATDALERERTAAEARQNSIALAIKTQMQSQIEELNDQLELCKQTLYDVLTLEYGLAVPENEPLEKLIKNVNIQIKNRGEEQFVYADAMRLRAILRLKPEDSLVETSQALNYSFGQQTETITKLNTELKELNSDLSRVKRENQKLERIKGEITEWNNWSRSMLRQINDITGPTIGASEVRFLLEEALLASIAHRSLLRKLELLRSEKRIILKSKAFLDRRPGGNTVKSVRPIMLSLICAKRLQQFCGCIPTKFSPKNSASSSPKSAPLVPIE